MKQGKEFFLNSDQLSNYIDAEKKKKIILPAGFKPTIDNKNERVMFLNKCIMTLRDKRLQTLLRLRVIAGWSYEKIAQQLQVPVDVVKKAEQMAKNQIKHNLESGGIRGN